jgi:DNA modification methylase
MTSRSTSPARTPTPRTPRARGTDHRPISLDRAKPTTRSVPDAAWRNRIVGHGEVDPATLRASPANWRSHPTAQQRALSGALGEVGWVAQVIVNRTTGHLVDGHLRVELALARHEPTVPVVYVELNPDEEAVVLASLDPIGAMATVERDALAELLARTETADADLQSLLTDLADRNGIRSTTGDPDLVPDLPDDAEIRVQPGELWALGDHRLLCGDATDPGAVTRLLEGAEPRLLVTDPPYGVELDGSWRDDAVADAAAGPRGAGHRNTTMPGDARIDWSEAYALVPSLAVGYVWHAGVHAATVAAGLTSIGFEIVSQVIWDKGPFALGRSWYHWGHEPCWVVRKPGATHLFRGSRDQGTIWRVPSPKMVTAGSGEAKHDHPTQKPVALFEAPIRNHLEPGELAYDPFLGSGTALIAAESLGRRCYGLEIDPRYASLTIERWEAVTGQRAERVDA